MKRIVRLTEGDLHRIVKKSVNRILRESEIDGDKNFDDAGFVDSISKFCEKPVDMNNYDPSDEDIYGALGEFNPDDLDTDFSDLMSYNQNDDFNESRRRLGKIVRESINKVLKEGDMYKNGMLTRDGAISVNNINVGNRQKEFNKKYTPDFKKRKVKK